MYLGDFTMGGIVDVYFTTNAAAGGRSAFLNALEPADIRIYKGTVARASQNGYTVDTDIVTGLTHIRIDTGDNSDAGFYSRRSNFGLVLYPDTETVDGQAPAAAWIFSIENRNKGELWGGQLAAIDATSVTLPAANGLDHEGNYFIQLEGGNNARGKGRYLKYNSAEKWDVSPAWNSDGETTPTGVVVGSILMAPKAPTDVTMIPKVTVIGFLGTLLTETVVGYITGAFKKVFDVTAPVFTAQSVNQSGDSFGIVKAGGAGDAAAIKFKTDNLPSDPADESLLIAATDSIMTRLGVPANVTVAADIAAVFNKTPAVSDIPTAIQNADAFLNRNQQGGTNNAPHVKDAIAGGLMSFTINPSTGLLTVKNGDGTTAYTRTISRLALDAIISSL